MVDRAEEIVGKNADALAMGGSDTTLEETRQLLYELQVHQFLLRKDGSMALPFASEDVYGLFKVSSDDEKEDAAPLLPPFIRRVATSSFLQSTIPPKPFPPGSRIFASCLPMAASTGSLPIHCLSNTAMKALSGMVLSSISSARKFYMIVKDQSVLLR